MWRWVSVAVTEIIHERQIARHGGLPGIRDAGALASALDRPCNLAAYGEPDIAALAAAYVHGLVRNHPFNDANKRTAWVVSRLFLRDNDHVFLFDPADAVDTIRRSASSQMPEVDLAFWYRLRVYHGSQPAQAHPITEPE